MKHLTQDRVRELFDYNQLTGELFWKVGKSNVPAGQLVGNLYRNPRRGKYVLQVGVDGKTYYCHRIIYLWVTGKLPAEIDHIDGNPMNNKFSNLRDATHAQNSRNSGLRRDNKIRLKGVRVQLRTGKYESHITVGGKQIHLGTFPTPELAHAAYCEAATKHFGEFARPA